jgi:hypothetical protein
MKKIATLLTLLMLCVGCGRPFSPDIVVTKERPTVNPPAALRQSNWLGSEGSGSCVHATVITLLRWQGRYHMADHWRNTYGNGETADDLAAKFDREGIRYAYTANKNDVAFLEWACKTRRGCGVTVMGGQHMIALVYLDEKWAGLLDDNATSHYIWVPREHFLAEWKASNSWAVTPIYAPTAPLPPSPVSEPNK